MSAPELVAESQAIVLGKLKIANIDASGDHKYTFQVLETLKGSVGDEFVVNVSGDLPGFRYSPFSHDDVYFWTHSRTSVKVDSDCSIRPNFLLGHTYLLFDGEYRTLKSFEEILFEQDKWLRYVRETLAGSTVSPLWIGAEFFDQFESVEIYQCAGRKKPFLKRILKGTDNEIGSLFIFGAPCHDKRAKHFLRMAGAENRPELFAPIIKGIAHLKQSIPELVLENTIDLRDEI